MTTLLRFVARARLDGPAAAVRANREALFGSDLYRRVTDFAGRWTLARRRAHRIKVAIARDQHHFWQHVATFSGREERHRVHAVSGWSDLLRTFAAAPA